MLQGKTILITGSGKGIGEATARLAVGYGARVVLHDRAEHEGLVALATELNQPYVTFDITDHAAVEQGTREAIKKAGSIQALANVAGSACHKTFEELTPEDWQAMVSVNLLGAVYVTQALVPHFRAAGSGRIVNVTSIRGGRSAGTPTSIAYGAAKAGLANLTTSLAKVLGPDIQVNAVASGPVTGTDISAQWTPEMVARNTSVPLQRMTERNEIAEAILFLLSDRAKAITGAELVVDCGYSLGKL